MQEEGQLYWFSRSIWQEQYTELCVDKVLAWFRSVCTGLAVSRAAGCCSLSKKTQNSWRNNTSCGLSLPTSPGGRACVGAPWLVPLRSSSLGASPLMQAGVFWSRLAELQDWVAFCKGQWGGAREWSHLWRAQLSANFVLMASRYDCKINRYKQL